MSENKNKVDFRSKPEQKKYCIFLMSLILLLLTSCVSTPKATPVAPTRSTHQYSDADFKTIYHDKASIKKAQKLLIKLGYKIGAIDGILGNKTRDAIMSYQTCQGLSSDGNISKGLLSALSQDVGPSNAPVYGSQELTKKNKEERAIIKTGIIAASTSVFWKLSDKLGLSEPVAVGIGVAAGNHAGEKAADAVEERRNTAAMAYDEVNKQISETQLKITQCKLLVCDIDRNIANRTQEIHQLKKSTRKNKQKMDQAKLMMVAVKKEIDRINAIETETSIALNLVEKELNRINSELTQQTNNNVELENARNRLLERRQLLISSLNALFEIEPKLEQQEAELSGLSLG